MSRQKKSGNTGKPINFLLKRSCFCSFNATPQALFDEYTGPLIRQIAAISTIYRIDDCALAVLDEGAALDEAALDIERLRNYVSPSPSLQYALEAGKKSGV